MKRRRISWPLALVVCALLGSALTWYAIRRVTEIPGEAVAAVEQQSIKSAAKVRDAFVELFHLRPNVVVRDGVAVAPTTTPVSQLAVAGRDLEVSRETTATWWGSTKTLRVRATYRVQAGFDLAKVFVVEVTGTQVRVQVPHAQILTSEPLETHVDELRDGLWNRIQASDVQAELSALRDAARAQAADLAACAEDQFQKALRDRLAPAGVTVQVRFADEPPPASPGADRR